MKKVKVKVKVGKGAGKMMKVQKPKVPKTKVGKLPNGYAKLPRVRNDI